MKHLKRTTELVKAILEEIPETRNDDDYLYYKACERVNRESLDLPFCMVIMNRKEFGYPPFESVRRTRQKIQEKHPELSGAADVVEIRKNAEKVFRDYARSNI